MSAMVEYPELIQGSDEWLEARRGVVTASVIGRLITPTLKVANNETARTLTRTLVAESITGHIEPVFVSNDMFRGQMDEPLARDLYSRLHAPATELGFMTRDIDGARLGYSPDGLVGDDGLIEVKSAKPAIHVARVLGAPIDHMHMAQMQAGMLVSGRSWCDYVSYCGGLPMWVTRVEADPSWFAAITEAVSAFTEASETLLAEYSEAVKGLPTTERIDYFQEPR